MVVAIAVGPLLDVGLAFLVVPGAECEAVVLVVETGGFEVLRRGVGTAAEVIDI